jgi:hypothetical protein
MQPANGRVEPRNRLQFIVRPADGQWKVHCDEEVVAAAPTCGEAEREATKLARRAHDEGRLTQILIRA